MINKTETWLVNHKGQHTGLTYLFMHAHNPRILQSLDVFTDSNTVGTYHKAFWKKYDE